MRLDAERGRRFSAGRSRWGANTRGGRRRRTDPAVGADAGAGAPRACAVGSAAVDPDASPIWPATSHASHWPLHAESQQYPSTQKFEAHSEAFAQAVPRSPAQTPGFVAVSHLRPRLHDAAAQQTESVQLPVVHSYPAVHATPGSSENSSESREREVGVGVRSIASADDEHAARRERRRRRVATRGGHRAAGRPLVRRGIVQLCAVEVVGLAVHGAGARSAADHRPDEHPGGRPDVCGHRVAASKRHRAGGGPRSGRRGQSSAEVEEGGVCYWRPGPFRTAAACSCGSFAALRHPSRPMNSSPGS